MSSCRKANAAIERAPGQNPLSRLIDEAHAGEIIVLAKAGMRSRGPLSQPDVLLTVDPQLSTFPCQTLW